jgi:hypothetical protein
MTAQINHENNEADQRIQQKLNLLARVFKDLRERTYVKVVLRDLPGVLSQLYVSRVADKRDLIRLCIAFSISVVFATIAQ